MEKLCGKDAERIKFNEILLTNINITNVCIQKQNFV